MASDPMSESQRDRGSLLPTGSDRPVLPSWLATVDHKRVGRRYILTALVFFVIAGVLAMLMRIQLSEPQNDFLGPARYNQMFAMHGAMMLLLFAMPVMQAVAVYIIPLMIGARRIALPRLNAFSYWVYLFGGIVALAAFLLAGTKPASGRHANAWTVMVVSSGLAALCVAVALIATLLAMRAPGMTLRRMPLFAWSVLVASMVAIVAMPVMMFDVALPHADRIAAVEFGRPMIFILLIPALGMISSIVETFSRRPVFGYPAMVAALLATGLFAFAPWAQHVSGDGMRVAIGMAIAIPIGVQFFCWIATLWTGKPTVTAPLLFVLGCLVLFALGAITAAMLAPLPSDARLRGSYFEVAQLHYVLIGGAVFPLMGALYYWFPKFSGRMLSESFGRLQFWLLFIGVNVTFLPMHLLGWLGMPRSVYTYPGGMGWNLPNMVASLGSWIIAGSVLVFAFNIFYALRAGRPAGDNPWRAPTLEWATLSPPAPCNFEAVPTVRGREPLWPIDTALPLKTGLATDRREALPAAPAEAHSTTHAAMTAPSTWPLLCALALTALISWTILGHGIRLGA
jgi:cytochrome c oxidase subunit I+III